MAHPGDDDEVPTAWALRWQADYCRGQDAPIAGTACDAIADALEPGGALGALVPPVVRQGDWVGLRFLGLTHRLAIDRRAPAVALAAPTLGGISPFDASDPDAAVAAFRSAVVEALATHGDEVTAAMGRTPQTNDPGRSRALRLALAAAAADPGLPVRLIEVGASAGLNLRADHLPGAPDLEVGPQPDVVERRGCDLNPVDPTTPEGRIWLSGFVWFDHTERFAALAHALHVAQRVPAEVVRADAAEFVGALRVEVGATTVVWHSAVWPYLPPERRDALTDALATLGSTATPTAPLWHVSFEPGPLGPDHCELLVERFTGDEPTQKVVAVGGPHGQALALT